MTTIASPELLEKHNAYIARCKANGAPTQTYNTPCCSRELEDRVPPEGEGPWDSLVTCPYCGDLFWKVAHHDGIAGHIPT